MLASHVNGERTREHPHFLKGSLYCRSCGSRLIITYSRSRSGARYPYFICAGRHSKRVRDCKQKAVLIGEVERRVEEVYNRYSLPSGIREYLEKWLRDHIEVEREKHSVQLDGLRRERDKLERQRKKLLEAHYNDAIPLDLLKSEQQKITKQLATIEHEIKANEYTFDTIQKRLGDALDLIEDCGKTYRMASDHIKRMMNQAILSKLWVDSDGCVTAEFAEPFRTLVSSVQADIIRSRKEEIRGTTQVLTDSLPLINKLSVAIQERLSKFFGNCLNNDFLVALGRVYKNLHRPRAAISSGLLQQGG